MTNKLASMALQRKVSNSESLSILRVVTGQKTESQMLKFHYDAYALTALIPIFIPDGPTTESGHLVSWLNLRKFRKLQFVNLLEKSIIQNKFIRKILGYVVQNNLDKYMHKIIPGNIYLFWGYRSLHANLSVNKSLLRSTLLFHNGNVHNDSLIDTWIKKIRHSSERKNEAQN